MLIFYLKAATAFSVAIASLLALRSSRFEAILKSYRIVVILSLIIRLLILALLHGVLRLRYPHDIPGYFDQANDVLFGLVPNRDFNTPYGFLFSYATAASIAIWKTPLAIMFLFTIAEHVGLLFLAQAIRRDYGAEYAFKFSLLYALNPLIIVSFLLSGQDEALLIFGLGCTVMVISWANPIARAIAYILTETVSKLFALWFIVQALVKERWPARFAVILIAAVMAGCFHYFGIRLTSVDFDHKNGAIDHLASLTTSGNIYYLLANWVDVGHTIPYVILAGLLGVTELLVAFFGSNKRTVQVIIIGAATLALAYQLGAQMTFSYYLVTAVPGLLLATVLQRNSSRVAPVIIWSTISALDTELYFSLRESGHPLDISYIYSGLVVILNCGAYASCLRFLCGNRIPPAGNEGPLSISAPAKNDVLT